MRRLAAKGLHALLTDPATGEPLGWVECVSLFIGLLVGCAVLLAMIALSLGLGGGQ